ncbi:hypothetical protein SLA2020_199500 [Shorea laevis]
MESLRFLLCVFLLCANSDIQIRGHDLLKDHVAFFIFGDSIFDPGNNNYFNTTAQANYPPYGETFFKYPTGRFSDGRIIPDFIAEYAKLPLIPPYLQPGNHQFTYGVNFASGGAGALVETNQGLVIDLKTQISYFRKVVKLLRQNLGDAKAKTLLSRAVYLIMIGTNDYGSPILANSPVPKSLWDEFVGMVIGNLTASIEDIYKLRGRKFGLLSLGQLGCRPILRVLVPANLSSCYEEATALADLHDRALSKALQELQSRLKGFKYAYQNMTLFLSEGVNDLSKYGLKEGKAACCGSGRYRGVCSCGGKRGLTEYELCENPNEYLFFDCAHFTDRANSKIAELMWSGNSSVIGPYNLKELFSTY